MLWPVHQRVKEHSEEGLESEDILVAGLCRAVTNGVLNVGWGPPEGGEAGGDLLQAWPLSASCEVGGRILKSLFCQKQAPVLCLTHNRAVSLYCFTAPTKALLLTAHKTTALREVWGRGFSSAVTHAELLSGTEEGGEALPHRL